MKKQSYTIKTEVYQRDQAAIEDLWEGVLVAPVAGRYKGDKMAAHFAMFFRIWGQVFF